MKKISFLAIAAAFLFASRVINHQFLIAINKRRESESRKRQTKKHPLKANKIKYIIKNSRRKS